MSERDVSEGSLPHEQDQRTEEFEEVAASSSEGDGESSPPVQVPFVTRESETGV